MSSRRPLLLVLLALLFAMDSAKNLVASEPTARSLFNGKNLEDWDGDPRFWRVENGEIVGQTTAEVSPSQNTFLIYRGEEFGDFDLTFSYRVEGYNSGVQYRSVDNGDWSVSGLQADFEAPRHPVDGKQVDLYSGMFFEEKGRMFLGQRGQFVIVQGGPNDDSKPQVEIVASLGDAAELEKVIRRDDWNQYRILARGFHFFHIINGRVMSIGIDEDEENRRASGIIAFQLHKGPPMQIRVKDIQIRSLTSK